MILCSQNCSLLWGSFPGFPYCYGDTGILPNKKEYIAVLIERYCTDECGPTRKYLTNSSNSIAVEQFGVCQRVSELIIKSRYVRYNKCIWRWWKSIRQLFKNNYCVSVCRILYETGFHLARMSCGWFNQQSVDTKTTVDQRFKSVTILACLFMHFI